jgi:hypothetical protein
MPDMPVRVDAFDHTAAMHAVVTGDTETAKRIVADMLHGELTDFYASAALLLDITVREMRARGYRV